jgi:hypothetical protein
MTVGKTGGRAGYFRIGDVTGNGDGNQRGKKRNDYQQFYQHKTLYPVFLFHGLTSGIFPSGLWNLSYLPPFFLWQRIFQMFAHR